LLTVALITVFFARFLDAIARETAIKKWRREKKVALIQERNASWEDLAEVWGEPVDMRIQREAGSSCLAALARRNDRE